LTTWDAAGTITGGPLGSKCTPRAGAAGGVWLRRIGTRVVMSIQNMTVTAGDLAGEQALIAHFVAGFRPRSTMVLGVAAFESSGRSSPMMIRASLGTGAVLVDFPQSHAVARSLLTELTWETDEAWPSAQPLQRQHEEHVTQPDGWTGEIE
jgi:hypothetical protein